MDTGVSHTCVDSTILQALDLSPTGSANVVTASSGAEAHPCHEYDVSLTIFMNNHELHLVSLAIPVVELQLMKSGFGVLIGRDVLAQGVLVYNGKNGDLSLNF